MLRDVDLSVGSKTSLFCSDVVAFTAIFPSTCRTRAWRGLAVDRQREEKNKRQKAGYFFEQEYIARFTQHFVEHCAILLCSSHSVNVGGITLRKDPDPQRMI